MKFSASAVAVTSEEPSSTFVPVDKSTVVVIVTEPFTMLMLPPRATAASRVDALEIVRFWL